MWENTTLSTELPRDFCSRIGPLQLGVVLVHFHFASILFINNDNIYTYTTLAMSMLQICTLFGALLDHRQNGLQHNISVYVCVSVSYTEYICVCFM